MNTPVSAHPADQGNPVIWKIHAASGKITTLAGTGIAGYGGGPACLPNSRLRNVLLWIAPPTLPQIKATAFSGR